MTEEEVLGLFEGVELEGVEEEGQQRIDDMKARLRGALEGAAMTEKPPPFFERAVEKLRGLAGKDKAQDRCLHMFSYLLACLAWMCEIMVQVWPDKGLLAFSEVVDEQEVAKAAEAIVSEMGKCHPLCKKQRCLTRDLADISGQAGWDQGLLDLVAAIGVKVHNLLATAQKMAGPTSQREREPIIAITFIRTARASFRKLSQNRELGGCCF